MVLCKGSIILATGFYHRAFFCAGLPALTVTAKNAYLYRCKTAKAFFRYGKANKFVTTTAKGIEKNRPSAY
ncbi:hypothetical protein C7N43_13460 [Sphingobacteriales bacterium UPWRP_1]|nr:hypothetical protein B6N25_03590 [Sphingobacteriales bacterium TSM_CSS]PSJ76532.1 hypothetical protein C7N43_13460 [Sphingobacteriales bacterium UPWRP_1]